MIDPAWRAARNVLAVRLDNLGDVLLMTPALHAIKESLPEAKLTLLASPVGAQAGRLNRDVDEVVVYQAPWMDPWHELPQDWAREEAMIAALRRKSFDAAVIFTSFRQSPLPAAYLCYLAGVPLRAAASIDGPGSLLTTRHKHPDRPMHEVERALDLVGALGMGTDRLDLVLDVPPSARAAVAAHPALRRHDGGPLLVVHPGCSMPARTYPAAQYARVAELLIAQLGATVLLTGLERERELVERLHRDISAPNRGRAIPLAGEVPFDIFCGFVEAADLVITNNTGPMHVAAAVKTPVIALFALTNPPEQWRPWRVPHRLLYHDVPCRICYSRVCPYTHDCLRLVTPEAVAQAARELLDETANPAGRPRALEVAGAADAAT